MHLGVRHAGLHLLLNKCVVLGSSLLSSLSLFAQKSSGQPRVQNTGSVMKSQEFRVLTVLLTMGYLVVNSFLPQNQYELIQTRGIREKNALV